MPSSTGCWSVPAEQIGISVRDPRKAVGFAERGVRVRRGDFDDAASLADAMARMGEAAPAERARMGAESRALAERNYDERIVIDAYLDAIRALPPR